MGLGIVVAFLGCFFVCFSFGERPSYQEDGSSVWIVNNTVLNSQFVMGIATVEFDQDLYVNGPTTACAFRELPCDSLSCNACDWSQQNASSCFDRNCCGPAQQGATDEQLDAWCDPSYEFTSLSFGDSEAFEIEEEEWRYHRFFLPESLYCQTIAITVRPYYGIFSMVLSSQIPNPDFTSYDLAMGDPTPELGMGVTSITLCPTAHSFYSPGTYAIGVYGLTPGSYRVDIEAASEKQPFAPPSDRISCSTVPESEFLRRGASGEPVVCLEDGVTQQINSSMASDLGATQVQMIFPLDIGCQKISFFGLALAETLEAVSFAIHCLSPDGSETTKYGNSLFTRFGSRRDQAVSFNLCFEEVTYLSCAMRFYSEGEVQAVFSTEAETLVRRMVDLPHTSLSFLDTLGGAIVAPFGERAWACGDFYTANYNWVSPPSTDPLVLFPVNANLRYFYYSSDLIQEYMDAGLTKPLSKTLVVSFAMNVGNAKMMSYNTSYLSLSVLGVTNEFGEPVQLPNDGPEFSSSTVPSYALASKYIPNIAISSLPVFEPATYCDSDKYTALEDLIQSKLDLLLDSSLSFDDVLFNKYAIDVFNSGIAGSSCSSAVSERLGTEINDVTLLDQIACLYDPVTEQLTWLFEACCDPFLELISCCLPYTYNTTLEQYTEESDSEGCGIPECASSYLEELGNTFNTIEDRILGCSSGIQEFPLALQALEVEDLDTYLVPCMVEAGFGDRFDGPSCLQDSDCDGWGGRCNFDTGICALGRLDDMEDTFLLCFIANMSTSLEMYIRETEFIKSDVPRDSPEFFIRVKRAASRTDCVNPHNPIDISKRERNVWDVQRLLCKADFLGVPVNDTTQMDELCPPGLCLGDFCRQNNSDCRARCNLAYSYVPLDEENCVETACVSDDGCDDENYCMYCPPNEGTCTVVTGVSDQETCQDSYACELPTGEVVFDLSEEECRDVGLCSSDCVGPSCVSYDGIEGVCAFEAADMATCEVFGTTNAETVEYDDTTCLVTSISTEQQCVSYQATTPEIEWYTCGSFATGGTCGSTTDFTEIQRYMNCYESFWKECETKEECLASGYCSDRPYTTIIHSYDYPIIPQIGSCLTSGEYFGSSVPFCDPQETYLRAGCLKPEVTSSELCPALYGNLIEQNWVTPATSEAECQDNTVKGRYGCLLPYPLDVLLWILDDSECDCWSGESSYSWEWTPGVWKTGVPRRLDWEQAAEEYFYELQDDRLSFILVSEWVQNNVLWKFLQVLRSEVVCTSNSVTYPMFTLVCDCLSDDQGEHCYTFANDKEILMGFSYACANEVSTIKHPSGNVAFFEDSMTIDCTDVNISIIYKNWYQAPFITPPVSFEWEAPAEIGPVVNHHETTVGVLVGDGCVLSFSNPTPVATFQVCLLYSPPDDTKSSYKVRDFGYIPNIDSEFIYPLGLQEITTETRVDSIFYCAMVDYSEVPSDSDSDIYLFPILRLEYYESEDDDYVSRQTEILMYFLGACYCVLIPILLYSPYRYFAVSRRGGAPLSSFMAILFVVLCIFRAVFMFMYPNGVFEGNSLAEFVVFEIPTFLLLSVVIICIYYWKKVVIKKNHFIPEKSNKLIIYVGLGVVWSLWVIVTVVYSEVILEDGGVSPCGGRVATDYSDVEDSTRTLAIVYHSVIIGITLFLSLIFLYYTVIILSASQSRSLSGAKEYIVVIGGIICLAFILRSILFLLVLAIQFSSSIYLFITLFLTEVLLITVTQIQFLKRHFTNTVTRSTSPRSSSSSDTVTDRTTAPQYDL